MNHPGIKFGLFILAVILAGLIALKYTAVDRARGAAGLLIGKSLGLGYYSQRPIGVPPYGMP
jgi:hypothetical protein